MSLPIVSNALPMIVDYGLRQYPASNDPQSVNGTSLWINAFNINGSSVPLSDYPSNLKRQQIALIDDGVYRNHEDVGRISAIGVNAYDRSYEVVQGGGQPNYKTNKPGLENNDYWHRYQGHGTQKCQLDERRNQQWKGHS